MKSAKYAKLFFINCNAIYCLNFKLIGAILIINVFILIQIAALFGENN
jgi:hypothetical protein